MKFSFYSANTIPANIAGSQEQLGGLPITFLDKSGGSTVPVLYSFVEQAETAVQNVISGGADVTTTELNNDVYLLSGQSVVYNILKTSGNWGVMTLDPVSSIATIVETVGDRVTIKFNAEGAGGAADYDSVDYDSVDYLTSGINSAVGVYEIDLLEDAVVVGTFNLRVFPTSMIRRVCPDNVLNFAFLNRSGGWNSYALDCKYIKGYDLGSQKTFETSSGVLKQTELGDVYETFEIVAEALTPTEIDLLSGLRRSIQAYLYNEATQAFDIPIVLDVGSFQTYGNRQRQPERSVSFGFRLAQREVVQTQ